VRDVDAPERIHEDPQQFFKALGVDPEHAVAFAGIGAKRLLLYRKLVRNGLLSAIRKLIPRTAARLDPFFDVWVDRYCDLEMPRSHYLRDVATEFVDWVLPQWMANKTVPRYLSDLARFELVDFHIAIAMSEVREISGHELALDKPILFDTSVRMAQFAYAVQRLDEDETDREVPVEESTRLLGYRDADYEVHFLELSPLAAGILERLLAGKTFGESVIDAFGGVPPASVLETIAQMLADLADKKALLGAG
jgi:hypothetical protein